MRQLPDTEQRLAEVSECQEGDNVRMSTDHGTLPVRMPEKRNLPPEVKPCYLVATELRMSTDHGTLPVRMPEKRNLPPEVKPCYLVATELRMSTDHGTLPVRMAGEEKPATRGETMLFSCYRVDSPEQPTTTWWSNCHSTSTKEEATQQDPQWTSRDHKML